MPNHSEEYLLDRHDQLLKVLPDLSEAIGEVIKAHAVRPEDILLALAVMSATYALKMNEDGLFTRDLDGPDGAFASVGRSALGIARKLADATVTETITVSRKPERHTH